MQDAGIECRKILAVVILIVCLIIFTAFKFNPIAQMNAHLWVGRIMAIILAKDWQARCLMVCCVALACGFRLPIACHSEGCWLGRYSSARRVGGYRYVIFEEALSIFYVFFRHVSFWWIVAGYV